MSKSWSLKKGLDFAGWSVGTLNDTKIGRLIEAQGVAAFTVYFYLCQHAYATHGYYLDWDYSCCAATARKLGKGASAEFVKNVVDMCFQCCLFDKRLFDKYGILTSRGIQRRYWIAIKHCGSNVEKKFWLLENCQGLEGCTQKSNKQPEDLISDTVHIDDNINKMKLNENTYTVTSASASGELSAKDVVDTFNRLCPSLPKVIALTDARRTAIRKAAERLGGADKFEEFFKRIEASDFLTGRNKIWKHCGFDWCLKAGNLIKIREGQYDNRVSDEGKAVDSEYEQMVEAYLPRYQKKGGGA